MESLRAKFIPAALGASSSLAGLLSLSKCSGSTCTSCYGCAGAGVGILMLMLFSRMKGNKRGEKNGMA
ncbi:MAG: hypothetical protein OEW04_05060 [Nitrospirota bacterium]|nr:hypothetical protein [Nitrospirota bacterium]